MVRRHFHWQAAPSYIRWVIAGFLLSTYLQAAPFDPENFFSSVPLSEPLVIAPYRDHQFDSFRAYGRQQAHAVWHQGLDKDQTPPEKAPEFEEYDQFKRYTSSSANQDTDLFLKGRYNRSRARLPENLESWRRNPDIANPGADLANWPNSAFTLPEGRAYFEFAPFGYYASSSNGPEQFDMEFLLRYGVTDNIELRVFTNGPTWTGGRFSEWSFAPLAFDTKVQCWVEKPDIYLPAMGIEAYVQTQWLGNTATNGGTQPAISFNFDQSLPWGIDLEYNLGTVRELNGSRNEWEFNFQWALQRDFFDEDFAMFIHGYANAATLPRTRNNSTGSLSPNAGASNQNEHAVGAGFIWTLNARLSVFSQTSFGTNSATPSIISYSGFALAF